ncbi:MAG: Gfo/Idh/MocA family oxidoreductase [Ruminococcaceae bacterium]|nr:Gfo/Idh/MocA family oxidoreductase [Oscillospiraceae bacterium]
MQKIKLGIIGFGNIGCGNHTKNIWKGKCPEVELAAVADHDPARLEACREMCKEYQKEYPDNNISEPLLFESAEAMMDAKVVDAVLVAVPHYDHPGLTIKALERGLHVMCEKPAGVYTLQVREMMACADKHPELVFGMMFNQRTNPVFRKMREIIQSGELGEIRRTNWLITNWYRPQYYYDSGAWRATWSGEGGGVLLNQCPHNLDLWQWICGMPKKIHAHMHFGKWHDIEVEDDVTAYAEYENGATGTFITTTGDTPGTNRFEVVCDGGTLICEDAKTLTLKKLEMTIDEYSRTNTTSAFGKPKAEIITPELEGENSQHVGVLNAFAAAILRGEPLVADGREGINGLMISNAMHLSAWEDRTVELPFDEQRFYDLLMERVKTSRRKENVASVVSDTEGSYNA